MLTPNDSAAAQASPIAAAESCPSTSRADAARTTPATAAASAVPTPGERCSPNATATTAATAPSVDAIGATTPTLPRRTAAYTRPSPATFPKPETASQPNDEPWGAAPPAASTAIPAGTSPTSITQASVGSAPIVRLARARLYIGNDSGITHLEPTEDGDQARREASPAIAAPISAVRSFRITRTGTPASRSVKRPFAVKQRMKTPSSSLGRIRGGIPPPR